MSNECDTAVAEIQSNDITALLYFLSLFFHSLSHFFRKVTLFLSFYDQKTSWRFNIYRFDKKKSINKQQTIRPNVNKNIE